MNKRLLFLMLVVVLGRVRVRRGVRRRRQDRDHGRRHRHHGRPVGRADQVRIRRRLHRLHGLRLRARRQGRQDRSCHAEQPVGGQAAAVLPRGQRLRPGRRGRQGPQAGGERQDQLHDRPHLLALGEVGGRLPRQVVGHPRDLHRRPADREPRDRQWARFHPHRVLRRARLLLRQVPRREGLQDGQRHQLRRHARLRPDRRLREGLRRPRAAAP